MFYLNIWTTNTTLQCAKQGASSVKLNGESKYRCPVRILSELEKFT